MSRAPGGCGEAVVADLGLEPSIAEDLALAAQAALLGGQAILPYYHSPDLTVDDMETGPVTSADRASHDAIVGFLRAHQADSVLSEEDARDEAAAGGERLWVVDPLDGTREFIDRIDEFSVMVGLAVDGAAVLGAVYRPDSEVLYLGHADRGAWRIDRRDGNRIRRLRVPAGSGDGGTALRFVRSRSHPDERLQRLERALAASVVLSGSVGVKCALIATGDADLYVHPVPYLKEWDTCAPEAVLRGAGGRITDCRGGPLVYGKPEPVQPLGIFAGTPHAWTSAAPTVLGIAEDL